MDGGDTGLSGDGTYEGESELDDNVYAQLAQKEQDLLLAAELGKALLEKNEELEQRNASLVDEYTQKTEELEQERYSLQMQLTQQQTEFECTIKDLQEDIKTLRDQLSSQDSEVSAGNRKHTQDLRQLQQHNEALSEQLRQSAAQQDSLSAELEQLRNQLSRRRTSFDRRVDHLGELEDELESLRHRQQELESRIRSLTEERDALASELEDLQEYVLMLEKQRQRQDGQLNEQQRDIQELRETNSSLQVQLDHVTSLAHNSSGSSQTLFSELASMSDAPDGHPQMHNLDRVTSLSAEMLDEDDFECDDDDIIFTDAAMVSSPYPASSNPGGFLCLSDHRDDHHDTDSRMASTPVLDMMGEAGAEWGQEGAVSDGGHRLDSRQEESAASLVAQDPAPAARRHLSLTEELQTLLVEMSSQTTDRETGKAQSSTCDNDDDDDDGESSLISQDDRHARYKLHHQFSLPTVQPDLTDILQDQQNRLQALQKECDRLQDQACGRLSPDDLLRQTRMERDAALKRVEELERDLAQSRQDVASLSAQLMAAIRQKVNLSQELDQWQVDLNDMLMLQMYSRITEQQRAEQAIGQLEKQVKAKTTTAPSPLKLHKS